MTNRVHRANKIVRFIPANSCIVMRARMFIFSSNIVKWLIRQSFSSPGENRAHKSIDFDQGTLTHIFLAENNEMKTSGRSSRTIVTTSLSVTRRNFGPKNSRLGDNVKTEKIPSYINHENYVLSHKKFPGRRSQLYIPYWEKVRNDETKPLVHEE